MQVAKLLPGQESVASIEHLPRSKRCQAYFADKCVEVQDEQVRTIHRVSEKCRGRPGEVSSVSKGHHVVNMPGLHQLISSAGEGAAASTGGAPVSQAGAVKRSTVTFFGSDNQWSESKRCKLAADKSNVATTARLHRV